MTQHHLDYLQQLEAEIKGITSELSDANKRHNEMQEQLRQAVESGAFKAEIAPVEIAGNAIVLNDC